MKATEAALFRLQLCQGFLAEAEQDFSLERWRSCVDNSQLAIENAGKVVLTLFGVSPKTHDPARPIAALLEIHEVPAEMKSLIQQLLPDLLAFGAAEHFLTDYGDETTMTLPWSLFNQESAREALAGARRCDKLAVAVVEAAGK